MARTSTGTLCAGALARFDQGRAIGDIAWFGLICGLLFLVIGSVMAIVRSRRKPNHG